MTQTVATMIATHDARFLTWLVKNEVCIHPRPVRDGFYAGILPLLFTHAIILGRMGDLYGYEDRWCFSDLEKAKAALDAWDGVGEPQGWHRHPDSGRRRPDGDKNLEYIAT